MEEILWDEIVSIEEIGDDECYDITLLEDDVYLGEPNFIAEKIVVHNCGMDARYCKRKKGEEPYLLHPLMEPILKSTYGVMCYQEQVMQILHAVGDIPLIHCEKVRKAISKKKVSEFAKYKEMFIENGQVNLQANKDFVEDLWMQVSSFAEYGFNKSHAVAYTYISSRLLWLKAHYPLEFYTATLMCESDHDKIKAYKLDAQYHGIKVNKVNINKSKDNFSIADDEIYFGFSNIKKVGDKVAERIIAHQPYNDFFDFLDRFGTEATPVKALISIGAFDEGCSRLELWKFYEAYKSKQKRGKDRDKRREKSLDSQDKELRNLLLTGVEESHPDFEKMCKFDDEAVELWKQFAEIERQVPYNYKGEVRMRHTTFAALLNKVKDKRDKSNRNYELKIKEDQEEDIALESIDVGKIKVDPKLEDILIDEIKHEGESHYPKAEREYYGFQWVSNVERSKDYTGETIDRFLEEVEQNSVSVGRVEVELISVRHRLSKSGTEFYSVDIEDANGKRMVVNVWMDDYIRWKDELKKGNLVKMRVKPPTGGFKTLSFDAPQKRFRHQLIPKKKEDDERLIVMKDPDKEEEVDVTDLLPDDSSHVSMPSLDEIDDLNV